MGRETSFQIPGLPQASWWPRASYFFSPDLEFPLNQTGLIEAFSECCVLNNDRETLRGLWHRDTE